MNSETNLKIELFKTLTAHAFISFTLVGALMTACHYQEKKFFSSLQSKDPQKTSLAVR